MNIEKEHSYKVKVDVAYLDVMGYIKPHGYQHLIIKVIDEHLVKFNMDFDACKEKHFSWMLVSLNVDIKKHVQGCADLQIKTWHSERKRIYFRREIMATDENGEVVFVASIYLILLDLKTQTIYRKAELPFDFMPPYPEFLLESKPSFTENLTYKKNCDRLVYRSYIDALGHVNNCRYGEFAFDSLPAQYADLSKIKAFDIYFCSELKENDSFTVEEHIQENEERIILHGYNNSKGKSTFYSVFYKPMCNTNNID